MTPQVRRRVSNSDNLINKDTKQKIVKPVSASIHGTNKAVCASEGFLIRGRAALLFLFLLLLGLIRVRVIIALPLLVLLIFLLLLLVLLLLLLLRAVLNVLHGNIVGSIVATARVSGLLVFLNLGGLGLHGDGAAAIKLLDPIGDELERLNANLLRVLIAEGVDADREGGLVGEDAGDLTLALGLRLADQRSLENEMSNKAGKGLIKQDGRGR